MSDTPYDLMLADANIVELIRVLGTLPPQPDEVEAANRILSAAPTGPTALSVARYFETLSDKNADGEPYNAEWKSRANPVIVRFFFDATTLKQPEGDETYWCAAFVNWCLMRAGSKGTNSASSGTFRCAGSAANTPSEGDIAVFRQPDSHDQCQGRGHVGFFIRELDETVEVLGGNQRNRVQKSRYKKDGSSLIYLGSRQLSSFGANI